MATKTGHHPFNATEWETLKRLAKTLHKWAEDECNGAIQWEGISEETPRRYYVDSYGCYSKPGPIIRNKEQECLNTAARLAASHGLSIYHQTDPRGIALYVYNASDSKGRIDELYSSIGKPVC
jgi:hypothetical protein